MTRTRWRARITGVIKRLIGTDADKHYGQYKLEVVMHRSPRTETRELNAKERGLLRDLLKRTGERGQRHLSGADSLIVVGSCPCGCPSVLLGRAKETPHVGPSEVLACFEGQTDDGDRVEVLLREYRGNLVELEVVNYVNAKSRALPGSEALQKTAW